MVNYNIRRNEFNGFENPEKIGDYLKWTDYTLSLLKCIITLVPFRELVQFFVKQPRF